MPGGTAAAASTARKVSPRAPSAASTSLVNTLYPETVPTAYREPAGLAGVPNRRFDTVLMGAATYRVVLDAGLASPYGHLRQYVVSTSLAGTADPVRLFSGDPLDLARELKREEGMDIWLCGGGRLAAALLPEIDELLIKSYPVVAGAGVPVFEGAFGPTVFEPAERTAFANGVTLTRFVRPTAR
ncbi:deaminase [Actinorhabdospora filicis]|uniref:Deaminase n=1 Tax=Actinorhabdospora filicis TaxID=1785913 RepID=A0A9W6W6W2_9ACTN|nr:dihydrofolate reductase family protein [Actinorhabdospora filicis]GLZ75338.1 deaminase [Actinorhabdospora filicis]